MRRSVAGWSVGVWSVAVLTTVTGLPWAVRNRLPDRLATHWDGSAGAPDDSMPFWAAALLPGLMWAVLVLVVLLVCRRAGVGASVRFRAGTAAALLSGGVFLAGVQACVVLSNLDHADWREADSPVVWAVVSGLSAVLAGLGGWLGVVRTRART
ncbi:DUF1648 domain-containing protein [Streptomyces sp. NPDC059851]|uniref:DUF1648 domain-containing protein n=1 Tax=Streptomyces sp. NPDC059851 TaxID=3346971 RepID=UPI00365CE63B